MGSKKSSLSIIIITALISLILSFGLIVGIYYGLTKSKKSLPDVLKNIFIDEGEETISMAELKSLIEDASDLVSQRYYYSAVAKYQKDGAKFIGLTVPLTEETTLILYSGVISVGIDISEIDCSIDEAQKVIALTMPEPKIIAHEFDHDSVESYEMKTALFSRTTYEEYSEIIAEAQKEEEENLISNSDFMEDVVENAQTVLSNLLTATGASEEYQIVFETVS